jgi:hypothetical protein
MVNKLKAGTDPYPSLFQKAIIRKFLWEAAFSLEIGYKGIYKKDVSYVAGCCFRTVSCLNQVLFALNETYWMNEKGAVAIADSFNTVPSEYSHRVNNLFALVTENQDGVKKALSMLRALIDETEKHAKSKMCPD